MSMVIDGTNGLTFNNATTQNSGGKVLQVVNATYSTGVTNTTSTVADTGLTATITPLFTTSKILVIVHQEGVSKSTSDTAVVITLVRGSTTLITFSNFAGQTSSTATNTVGGCGTGYLDSPATTSATTYKTQFYSYSNTNGVSVQKNNETSTITLMEIAV